MTQLVIIRKNSNTKKRRRLRLRRSIRQFIISTFIITIGAIALAAMFFGAAIQEQDKLAVMAVAEVQE